MIAITQIPTKGINDALDTSANLGGNVFLMTALLVLCGVIIVGCGYVALSLVPKLLSDEREFTRQIAGDHKDALDTVTKDHKETIKLMADELKTQSIEQRKHDSEQNNQLLRQVQELTLAIANLNNSIACRNPSNTKS